jgi:Na+/proline symporter
MSGFSAWSFTGGAARIYETGLFFLVLFGANAVADLVTYFFLAKKFRQMRVVTVVEAIRKRFGPVNEQVFTWIQVPLRLFYAGLGLYTLAVFTSGAFGLNMLQLMIVLGIAVTVMSVSGGAWAINAGQFVQAILFLCITGIMVFTTLAHPQVGGISGLVRQLPAAHLNWTAFERPSILAIFIATLLFNQVIQRNALQEGAAKFLIVKNGRDAKRVALLGIVCVFVLTPMWMIPAMGSVIVHPNLGDTYKLNNPNEAAYIAMAQTTLPPGLLGLLICAIFSASLDALSSGVNTVAGVLVRNFYLPILNPDASERKQVWIGRALSAIGGAMMIVIALLVGRSTSMPLYSLMILVAAAVGLPQAVPLFLGTFVRRAPSMALWSTLAIGFACSVLMARYLTNDMLAAWWGSTERPLSTFEINDLRVAVITAVLLFVCVGWFAVCTAFGRRLDSPARNAEVDAFFIEMNTPIDDAAEHAGEGYESDERQYRVLGVLSLAFGAFLAAMAILPNTASGRLGLVFCGGAIAAVGALLYAIARRKSAAIITRVAGSAGHAPTLVPTP